MKRRVVVTGLGCVSPVGNTVKETWNALLEGKSGVAPITLFDASTHKTKFAAEVKGFDPLKEDEHWKLEDGNKYYICRDTSVIAFILGKENLRDSGYKIADTILKNK